MGKLFDLLDQAIRYVDQQVDNYNDSFSDSYSYSSERYSNMTDEQLKREIQRIKNSSGGDAKRMGKIKAMQDELASRR